LVSVGSTAKLPFFLLLSSALWQALYFSFCSPLGFVALSCFDKFMIYTSMVLGAGLGYILTLSNRRLSRQLVNLEAASRSLTSLLVPIGSRRGNEVLFLQGLGVSRAQSLLNSKP